MSSDDESFEFTGQYLPSGRPIYQNQFGDYVTERTITEYVPELGGWVNIPTFYHGRLLSPDDAINMAIEHKGNDPITGTALDKFQDMNDAIKAAESRSHSLGGLINLRGAK